MFSLVDTLADRKDAFIFEIWYLVWYQILWIRYMKLIEMLTSFSYFFLIVANFKFDPHFFFLLRWKDPEDFGYFFLNWPLTCTDCSEASKLSFTPPVEYWILKELYSQHWFIFHWGILNPPSSVLNLDASSWTLNASKLSRQS